MTLNLTPCTEHVFQLGMNEVVTINGVPFVHIGSGMVMGYTDPEVARAKGIGVGLSKWTPVQCIRCGDTGWWGDPAQERLQPCHECDLGKRNEPGREQDTVTSAA